MNEPYLTMRQLTAYSTLSKWSLLRAMSDPVRPLPCHRIGRRVLFRASEFDAWLLARKADAARRLDAMMTALLA